MSSINQIKKLEKERSQIINELLDYKDMIPGAYNEVFCKCGKDNCWCKQENKGHLFRRITWSENRRSMTKAIPEDDVSWIKNVTQNYRLFKEKLKRIKNIENQINKLLNDLSKSIIANTRKLKDYL